MYVNEFIDLLKSEECRGIQISERIANVLLYTDDMVLCADSVGDLQKQLYVLERYCTEWGMNVNHKKSKIVVFRKGGVIKDNERWFFNNQQVEIVSHYKYLRVMFGNTLKWNSAINTLVNQSSKAIVNFYKLDIMCGSMPPATAFSV